MDGWIHLHFSSPSFYFSFFILLPSLSFIHFLISFFYSHRSLPLYFLLSFFDCLPPLFIPLPSLLPNLLTIFLISYTSSFVSPTLFSFPLFFLVSSPHLLISFFASSFLSWPHLAPSSNPFLPVLSSLLSILFKSKMFVKLKPHLSSFFFFFYRFRLQESGGGLLPVVKSSSWAETKAEADGGSMFGEVSLRSSSVKVWRYTVTISCEVEVPSMFAGVVSSDPPGLNVSSTG